MALVSARAFFLRGTVLQPEDCAPV